MSITTTYPDGRTVTYYADEQGVFMDVDGEPVAQLEAADLLAYVEADLRAGATVIA